LTTIRFQLDPPFVDRRTWPGVSQSPTVARQGVSAEIAKSNRLAGAGATEDLACSEAPCLGDFVGSFDAARMDGRGSTPAGCSPIGCAILHPPSPSPAETAAEEAPNLREPGPPERPSIALWSGAPPEHNRGQHMRFGRAVMNRKQVEESPRGFSSVQPCQAWWHGRHQAMMNKSAG
jgi:hypothetical protein